MVRLKAYRCHDCSSICQEAAGAVGICVECGKLACGPCRALFKRESDKAPKCTVAQKNCEYASYYTAYINFLHEFPPDDELKLLNNGKWCPVWCTCGSSYAIQRIGYVGTSTLRCRSCRPADKVIKTLPINAYMKIVDELRDYFSEEDCIAPGARGIQLESFQCGKCHGKLPYPFYLTDTGDLLCAKCKDTPAAFFSVRKGNLSFLRILLNYIPDKDDLKLLTYSKWTPLRCELCSTLFSTNFLRNPIFHPGCSKLICNQCAWKHTCSEPNSTSLQLKWVLDVDKEFRSLFKNGGNDASATPLQKPEVDKELKKILSLASSYDFGPRSPTMSGIPEKLRCVCCTELNAPANVRTCIDCKKSCLCLLCLTKEHWGHHIEEFATSLQPAAIQEESMQTLKKLSKLKESVTEGYVQIDAVNMKVVDNYKYLYTKAIRGSDLALLQAIKERGDIGPLQKSVGEFTVAQIKLRSNVEELEKSLSEIVKEHPDSLLFFSEKSLCALTCIQGVDPRDKSYSD